MSDEAPQPEIESAPGKPETDATLFADYLWRPWYAKLWWAAIVIYWGLVWLTDGRGPYTPLQKGILGSLINILLLPVTAALLLGFRPLQRMSQPNGPGKDDVSDTWASFSWRRRRNYLSDPSDPRSPLSPLNPINRQWRQ